MNTLRSSELTQFKQDCIAVVRILTLILVQDLSYCRSLSLIAQILNSTSLRHASSSLFLSALLKVQGTYLKSSFQKMYGIFK